MRRRYRHRWVGGGDRSLHRGDAETSLSSSSTLLVMMIVCVIALVVSSRPWWWCCVVGGGRDGRHRRISGISGGGWCHGVGDRVVLPSSSNVVVVVQ